MNCERCEDFQKKLCLGRGVPEAGMCRKKKILLPETEEQKAEHLAADRALQQTATALGRRQRGETHKPKPSQ